MSAGRPRKVQERTAITRELLLRAAEQVFARVGYEKAQVEQIAESAGFSKGALYAHFKSKEDLFFALDRAKSESYRAKLQAAMNGASTREEKIAAFRDFYIDLSKDRDWALIILEVKLYMRRYPEAKSRLHRSNDQGDDSIEAVLIELFGASARAAGEALFGIFSSLVLESELMPKVVPETTMRAMLGTVFDALLKLRD